MNKIYYQFFIIISLYPLVNLLMEETNTNEETNFNGGVQHKFKTVASSNVLKRINSLTRLLQHIIAEYLSGCVIIVIRDEKVFVKYLGLFTGIFGDDDIRALFIQKNITNTLKTDKSLVSTVTLSDKCYHYVIFLDDIYHLNNIIAKETVNKVLVVTESTPWTVKDYLKSSPSRFYINLLVITHSMSKRSGEGSYLLYTHKLYTDGSGASLPVLLTSWIRNETTREKINLFPEKLSHGFKGHRLKIATAHKSPFATRTNVISQNGIEWDGIDVRIIRLVGNILNISADFRDPVTSSSPVYAATEDVLNGEASMALGGVYKTINITTRFDATYSHMEDCAAFISLSSLALPKYRAVMGPFQPTVWIMVCLVYLIAIIPLTMNTDYTYWSLLIHPSKLIDMFWYVFSTFTNSFVVKNPLLDTGLAKNSTSLLIGIYWVFTIIITSCYSGSIMAFITVPQFPEAIDTIEQLLGEGYDVGTLDHDGWENWFNWTRFEKDDPKTAGLLKSLEYVPTIKEGVRNASESFFWSYAFLGSKIILSYTVQEDFTPSWSTMRSPMHISKECVVNFGVTFILTKDSIYTEPINKVIMRAKESGLIQKIVWDVEWDIQRTEEGLRLPVSEEYKRRKITIQDRKLELDDTQGMFLVLGVGVLIAIIALSIECCVHKCKKRGSSNIDAISTKTSTSLATTGQMSTYFGALKSPWDVGMDSSLTDNRLLALHQRLNRCSI